MCYGTNGPVTLSGNAIQLCSVSDIVLAMLDGLLLPLVLDGNATMGEGHSFEMR